MTNIILETSNLNNPNELVRKKSIESLKTYLLTQDLETANVQRILKRLNKMNSKGAQEIVSFHEQLKNQPLTFENELLSYVKNSRIENKEFYEAKEFFKKVSPFIKADVVIDACAGNGLSGVIWALEGKANQVIFTDKDKNPYINGVIQFANTLKKINTTYDFQDLNDHPLPKGDFIMSIHACGTLTDKVMDESIYQNVPFAIMPCCHSDSTQISDENLKYFDNKTDAIDATRITYIQNNNYNVHIRKVDPKITEKNRIIIGLPNN